MYWLWRKKNKNNYTKEDFPAVLTIQVLYPSQKLRTFNLPAIPACPNNMCHSSVLQLKQTISCLFYSKPWNLLFPLQQPFVYFRFLHILSSEPCSDSITSSLLNLCLGYLISFTLSLQTTLCNCWLIKLLCTRLSSVKLHFLEVSCPEVGTFPCDTCLVVNKSKSFTFFSSSFFSWNTRPYFPPSE